MAALQPCNDETKLISVLQQPAQLCQLNKGVGCSTPSTQGAVPPLCKAEMAAAALHTEYSAVPVQTLPAAATLLRLAGAPLPTTRLLRLVTALPAGVNSTSLMGSSPESCRTRQSRSDALQCTESQQAFLCCMHMC